jgi:hypothetical protein
MMRNQFYEPLVEEQHLPTPIRGFQVTIGGTYVLLDDVVTVLREYAQSLGAIPEREIIHEVATWLQSGELPLPEQQPVQDPAPSPPQTFTPLDPELGVDRVEIYPDDPLALKPRWIARACSAEGDILYVTNGSIDQEYVIADAQQRWPGCDVHLLTEAGQDTVWEERDPGGIRSASNGRRRPSPKRLWGNP